MKLVAAEPSNGIPGPQGCRDAVRERNQQSVPDAMAEAVVDQLEAVDVEKQIRAAPGRVADRLLQAVGNPIQEQGPVGQVRESVMKGLVLQTHLHEVPVGDV